MMIMSVQKITTRKLKNMFGVDLLVVTEMFAFPHQLKIAQNGKVILIAPLKCSVNFTEHRIFKKDVPGALGFYLLTPEKDEIGTAEYTVSHSSRRGGRRGVLTSHSITVGSGFMRKKR